jgi:hypothetical protein
MTMLRKYAMFRYNMAGARPIFSEVYISPTPNTKKTRKSARVIRVLRPRLRAWASGCEHRARSRTPTPKSKLAKLELHAPIFAGFFPSRWGVWCVAT